MLEDSHPRSLRGVSGDDPEGGAGSGVLRQAARNRSPREAGTPPSRHAVPDPAQMPVRKARPREPKTATVERREASVPRHGTQGASLGAWRIAS
jgi:hypothetical protein